ncbi:uncharacterized protein LOC106050329 isoform X2 [Biomphalaria glabrata]|nr:uncharacterized protein LOC106050329 isoform X2 [Biomphalaria glabrata]XP_055879933.1 uncharacterized protein LOC106050329 isoform X2 [Biomphalaria glabrata]
MEVGKEFTSWESFQHALDQYSRESKVVYIVGTCKPVEAANRNESLQIKFPTKFKYCFARMLCKHYGNYTSQSIGQRPNQRTCKTGCTSSILVSVNKKRTALVIKEANLQHTHEVSELIFSKYSQNRRLQGEERRMATILLRAGVPVNRIQEFIFNCSTKSPTIKDLQNIKAAMKGYLPDNEGHEFDFLTSLDQLMAEDSQSIVEIINFDQVPGAIYIQTSKMLDRMKSFLGEGLQIITQSINDAKMPVVSIVGVDSDLNLHTFVFGILIVGGNSAFQYFLEAFVKNNQDFCDSMTGVVLDFPKEEAEFLLQLIPHVNVAWSQSYILQKFSEELDGKKDMQKMLVLQTDLMKSDNESIYKKKLKELCNVKGFSDYKEFLQNWDNCKDLWVQYELKSHNGLHHQKSAVELTYVNTLNVFVKPNMNLSELIEALLKFDRAEDPGKMSKEMSLSGVLHPSCEQYRQFCFPEASHAISCQIGIALSSSYCINVQSDMIFVKRSDSDQDYILDNDGSKCTCRYYIDTELPCQHIFAWLNYANKSLFQEHLVPVKWQVFGKSITLGALVESLAQGQVPSSFHHDQRLKELQGILKDTLTLCCSHSYEQMGKDLVLLRQVLMVMKSCLSQNTKLVTESQDEIIKDIPPESSTVSVLPRRRGRPSKKDKLLQTQQRQSVTEPPIPVAPQPSYTRSRHNLRTNIKHKFVTRDVHLEKQGEATPIKKLKESNSDQDKRGCRIKNVNSNHLNTVSNDIAMKETEETPASITADNETAQLQVKNTALKGRHSLSTNDSYHNKVISPEKPHLDSETISSHHASHVPPHNNDHRQKSDIEEGSDEEDENDSDDNEESEHAEENGLSGEDVSDEPVAKEENLLQKIKEYLQETAQESLLQLINTVVALSSDEEKAEFERKGLVLGPAHPVDSLTKMCSNTSLRDHIISHLRELSPNHSETVYQASAGIIEKSVQTGLPISQLSQILSYWPNHLPEFPSSRPLEGELTLIEGQILRLGSHKLNQLDIDTLRAGQEISVKILHAYLEILAQRHSGKIFIIPYDMVLSWRSGNYSDRIYKRVHLKTFEYIILPINCGAEFSLSERLTGDIPEPCWMTLVADIKEKTISVLNPKTEDKYAIAANGYMFQWRRYMQIRSIHTGEMLSTWTTKQIPCNTIEDNSSSGIHLLMNVEALVNKVSPLVMTSAHITNYFNLIAVALRDADQETTVLCVGGPECQTLAARDADWIQCENCRTWWHRACADLTKTIFYCNSCHQRILAVKGELPAPVQPHEEGDSECHSVEDINQ